MKKQEWGNAVWLLFHTLAEKIKPEYKEELIILVSHISSICNNLPCPECQSHASRTMNSINKSFISQSREHLIDFLWKFHNEVNKFTKSSFYPKESLSIYERSITINVINNFINIMSKVANNQKTMLFGFHRALYMKQFISYIQQNMHKYNL
jgi:hypothetical protein